MLVTQVGGVFELAKRGCKKSLENGISFLKLYLCIGKTPYSNKLILNQFGASFSSFTSGCFELCLISK